MLIEENLIKWIVAVVVIVLVIGGISLFFKDYVIDFFRGLGGEPAKAIFGILK
ncbi:MAG: hypothetical protein AABX79_02930 [Nanoarchaeota archaeon]